MSVDSSIPGSLSDYIGVWIFWRATFRAWSCSLRCLNTSYSQLAFSRSRVIYSQSRS